MKRFEDHSEQCNLDHIQMTILFNYGCLMNYSFRILEEQRPIFEDIDSNYQSSSVLLSILRTLLTEKRIKFLIKSSIDINNISESHPLLNDTLRDKTIDEIIKNLDSDGYLQISSNDDIEDLLFSFEFFDEWLNEWYSENNKNNRFTNINVLYEDFKRDFGIKPIKSKDDISLKYIDFLSYTISQHYKRLFGKENIKIDLSKKEYYFKRAQRSHCHVVLQKLSLFLRIENFFASDNHTSIDEIPLSNKELRFIYDFLNYFEIYFFIEEDTPNYTSTKEKLVKKIFNSFYKSKSNRIPIEQIYPLVKNIDKYKTLTETSNK